MSRDCALVCALFSWGSHPGGTQARGDLAASLPRQRSGLGQAAPPPRGDFRGHFRGLPGGGGWGQFCACVTLRKPTRFRHSPSRDPPPLALPVCTSTRGRADGLGGPRGPPLPLAGGAGGGGGRSGSEAGARTQPCSVTRAGCPDHRAPGLPHPAGLARPGRPSALRRLFSLQGTSLVCPPVPPLWLHPPAPRTPVATDVTSGACSTSPQVTDFTNWRRVCSLPRLCLRPHRPKRGSRAWQRAPHVRTSGWGLRATRAADQPAGSARPGGGAGRPPWAPAELEACSTFSLIYSSKLHVPQVVRGTLWVGFLQGVNSLRRSDLFFHRRPGRGWSRWPLQFRFHLRLK